MQEKTTNTTLIITKILRKDQLKFTFVSPLLMSSNERAIISTRTSGNICPIAVTVSGIELQIIIKIYQRSLNSKDIITIQFA